MPQIKNDPYDAINEILQNIPREKNARRARLKNMANELGIPNDLRTSVSVSFWLIANFLDNKIRNLKPGVTGTYGGGPATITRINRDCSIVIQILGGKKKTIANSYNFKTGEG